jgi:hypothetical protein
MAGSFLTDSEVPIDTNDLAWAAARHSDGMQVMEFLLAQLGAEHVGIAQSLQDQIWEQIGTRYRARVVVPVEQVTISPNDPI